MDWIERSNCDICAINETGLTGEEYMEVSDGYSWFAVNREEENSNGSVREVWWCRFHH